MEMRQRLFNFSSVEIDEKETKWIFIRISEYGRHEGSNLYFYLISSHLKTLIEFNGGRDVKYNIRETEEEGEPVCNIEFEWS